MTLYSNKAAITALTTAVGTTDTTLLVGSTSNWPTPATGQKAKGVIDAGLATVEVFSYTGVAVGQLLGVERGIDGTTASAHVIGAVVDHRVSAAFFEKVENWKRDVTDFGAVGDGVTDDTTAIQAAIDAGGEVFFPAGTFMVSDALTLGNNVHLKLDPAATIDFNNADATAVLFNATGTTSDAESLTANASTGDLSVTVAAGGEAAFAEGDLVRIRSEHQWDSVGASSKAGEFHYVKTTASGSITLRERLWDDYATADTATIEKVSPVGSITIDGGRFIGSGLAENQHFADFILCADIRIDSVEIDGFGNRAIDVESCVRVNLSRSHIHGSERDSLSYAITLRNGTQWVTIDGNHFRQMRTGVSSGGSSSGYGVVRFVSVIGNNMYGLVGGGVRAHSVSQGWTITGNTISAAEGVVMTGYGVLYRGVDASIVGNTIIGASLDGVHCLAQSDHPTRLSITGNTILRPGRCGIFIQTGQAYAIINGLSITGNTVEGWGAQVATERAIYIQAFTAGASMNNIAIVGNVLTNPVSSINAIRIRAQNHSITDGVISGNICEAGSEGIYVQADAPNALSGFAISGNRSYGGTRGIRGAGQTTCFVSGNNAQGSTAFIDGFAAAELGSNRTV